MDQDTKTPQQRHGPYTSALWDHLAEIKKLRQQRKTWEQVAAILADPKRDDKVVITGRAIRNFFIRSRKPGRRIPAGFEGTVLASGTSVNPTLPADHTLMSTLTQLEEGNARKEEVSDPAYSRHSQTHAKPATIKIQTFHPE